MPWLARLDARAARASVLVRWPYLALRWTLIALGVWVAIFQGFAEFSNGRPALAAGILVAIVAAGCKGVMIAIISHIPDWPSEPRRLPPAD